MYPLAVRPVARNTARQIAFVCESPRNTPKTRVSAIKFQSPKMSLKIQKPNFQRVKKHTCNKFRTFRAKFTVEMWRAFAPKLVFRLFEYSAVRASFGVKSTAMQVVDR